MKALTISQPFASLIAYGDKWVENRRWTTGYRGWLAIHAGKGTQYLSAKEARDEGYTTGAFIAVARLTGVVTRDEIRDPSLTTYFRTLGFDRCQLDDHEHSEGPFCWLLRDVRRIREPIQWSGALGLWDPPSEILMQLNRYTA